MTAAQHPTGPAHSRWTGDSPSYAAAHAWASRKFERTGVCESCGDEGAEWANKDHRYTRRREDWFELCRSCHRRYDDEQFGRSRRPHLHVTHCRYGHEFTPENTGYRTNGVRRCRACDRERATRQREAA